MSSAHRRRRRSAVPRSSRLVAGTTSFAPAASRKMTPKRSAVPSSILAFPTEILETGDRVGKWCQGKWRQEPFFGRPLLRMVFSTGEMFPDTISPHRPGLAENASPCEKRRSARDWRITTRGRHLRAEGVAGVCPRRPWNTWSR